MGLQQGHHGLILHVLQRQQQYKENQQRQIKFQNDYLLCLHSCNAFSNQYFNKDLLDLIEVSTSHCALSMCYCFL